MDTFRDVVELIEKLPSAIWAIIVSSLVYAILFKDRGLNREIQESRKKVDDGLSEVESSSARVEDREESLEKTLEDASIEEGRIEKSEEERKKELEDFLPGLKK